jgi:molybdate transport system substrate-binding protein
MTVRKHSRLWCFLLLALLNMAALSCKPSRAEPLTVFAAASLTDAMKEIVAAWQRDGHAAARLSFGASSTLARQIIQGAPVNLFIAADNQWMDELARGGAIAAESRRDLLSNSLVLIQPAPEKPTKPRTGPPPVTIGPGFDLASLLGRDGRLALGDPAHVPAGLYAAQALRNLGVWDSVRAHLAPTADVRAALLLVERGEAPFGIVYATDAAASARVTIAGRFPPGTHDLITYPAAIVRQGDTPDARAMMGFLTGPEARAIFTRHGFLME